MGENKNQDIPITLDFSDNLESVVGKLIAPENSSGRAQYLYYLLKQGYTFELAPTIQVNEQNEDGTIKSAELLSVSVVMSSKRKHFNRDMSLEMTPPIFGTKDLDPNIASLVNKNFEKLIWKDL